LFHDVLGLSLGNLDLLQDSLDRLEEVFFEVGTTVIHYDVCISFNTIPPSYILALTAFVHDRLCRCIREADGRSEHVKIVIHCPRQALFTLSKILLESREVNFREVLELCLNSTTVMSTIHLEKGDVAYLAKSLTHSLSLNSSRRSRSMCISIRFSRGAISGYSRPTVRKASTSQCRNTVAKRLQSVDTAEMRARI
jgi:hypothetical protein